MHIYGIECDVEKFVHNANCRIAKLIECENQHYAAHCDFTEMGLKELHYLLEDRKHIIGWKEDMHKYMMPAGEAMATTKNPY